MLNTMPKEVYFNDRRACPAHTDRLDSDGKCSSSFCCKRTLLQSIQWDFQIRGKCWVIRPTALQVSRWSSTGLVVLPELVQLFLLVLDGLIPPSPYEVFNSIVSCRPKTTYRGIRLLSELDIWQSYRDVKLHEETYLHVKTFYFLSSVI